MNANAPQTQSLEEQLKAAHTEIARLKQEQVTNNDIYTMNVLKTGRLKRELERAGEQRIGLLDATMALSFKAVELRQEIESLKGERESLLNRVRDVKEDGFNRGTKRKADSNDLEPSTKKSKNIDRVVVCIFCFKYDFTCDGGEPCQHCVKHGRICKRAKCDMFEDCQIPNCTRAHMDDTNYKNVVFAGRVPKAKFPQPGKPRSRKPKPRKENRISGGP
ncbi:hypothetical protein BDV96DRAFT_593515 [Lophiotrema nucula]|uniref:Uncharacterized protein n=1 Tax=Lophiotrema nucula TaxID=690887 RepID=A0A6A5ZU80_9PLEO|nr:hypothetical protein BDV96DRAFT_593515 [Lophiotrema nucula]